MRVACLISGLLRSFHHNVDHLKKALSNYQVDYFIHICSQVSDDYNHPETNYQHLFDLLEPTQMIIEKEILTSDNHLFKNMRKQWYKFYLINNLKNQYEKVNNFEYDLVIRVRPDVFILDKSILLETQIPNNILYGHNDEFFYGNSETMNIISKLILDFDHLLEKKPTRKSDFFELYLQQHKISLNKFKIDYKLVLSLCNIIAIAGDSGTGKTTLVSHLEKIFKDSTLKLEGDRYHKWERGHKNWEHYTHLNPEANYICKFQRMFLI